MGTYSTIDEYIAQFPADIQKILTKIRKTIRKVAPGATEKISYRMPAFFLGKNLVYFAVMKNHIGFYPGAEGVAAFAAELGGYKISKGAIQFPLSKPVPYDLIARITAFRAERDRKKTNLSLLIQSAVHNRVNSEMHAR
jgi:uncharacterized protein YdhG (YjbR/CyaY superfamily)